MKEIEEYQLLLLFQNALFFNITFHTRVILAEINDNRKLIMWVYFDRPPTQNEKDVYYSVSAEVRGQFADTYDSDIRFLTEDFNDEDAVGKLKLFARCDYLDLEGNLITS